MMMPVARMSGSMVPAIRKVRRDRNDRIRKASPARHPRRPVRRLARKVTWIRHRSRPLAGPPILQHAITAEGGTGMRHGTLGRRRFDLWMMGEGRVNIG